MVLVAIVIIIFHLDSIVLTEKTLNLVLKLVSCGGRLNVMWMQNIGNWNVRFYFDRNWLVYLLFFSYCTEGKFLLWQSLKLGMDSESYYNPNDHTSTFSESHYWSVIEGEMGNKRKRCYKKCLSKKKKKSAGSPLLPGHIHCVLERTELIVCENCKQKQRQRWDFEEKTGHGLSSGSLQSCTMYNNIKITIWTAPIRKSERDCCYLCSTTESRGSQVYRW